eukprot:gene20490-biopygen915
MSRGGFAGTGIELESNLPNPVDSRLEHPPREMNKMVKILKLLLSFESDKLIVGLVTRIGGPRGIGTT